MFSWVHSRPNPDSSLHVVMRYPSTFQVCCGWSIAVRILWFLSWVNTHPSSTFVVVVHSGPNPDSSLFVVIRSPSTFQLRCCGSIALSWAKYTNPNSTFVVVGPWPSESGFVASCRDSISIHIPGLLLWVHSRPNPDSWLLIVGQYPSEFNVFFRGSIAVRSRRS